MKRNTPIASKIGPVTLCLVVFTICCGGLRASDAGFDLSKGVERRLEVIEHQKRDLAIDELWALAIAMEDISEFLGFYPDQSEGLETARQGLGRVLSDSALVRIPKQDPWGGSYLLWSNKPNYIFLSHGPDGQPDYDYMSFVRSPPDDDWSRLCIGGDDLIVSNGFLMCQKKPYRRATPIDRDTP